MPRQDRVRQARGIAPAYPREASSRLEEKRSRFVDHPHHSTRGTGPAESPAPTVNRRRGLTPSALLLLGGVVLTTLVVGVTILRGTEAKTVSAAPVQQIPATTAATENGRVSVSVDEVVSKKLVAWDYRKDRITTPLLAYVTPSGAVKVATRMCEPCNSTSFRIEGNHLVCNACGSRWELETSKGIAGGCQGYPPEVLPSSIVDGKIVVDEQKVATWKPRV